MMISAEHVVTRSIRAAMVCTIAVSLWSPAGYGAFIPKLKSSRFWLGHWPNTVMITGNYAKPRLLAEMAQRETNLPIILISEEDGGDELYYLPKPPEVSRIKPSKLYELIDLFLTPKRVILIGDEDYVPRSYQKDIQDRYPTIIISGDSWVKNARELGKLIGVGNLHKKYRKSLMQLLEAESRGLNEPLGTEEELMMPTIQEFEE